MTTHHQITRLLHQSSHQYPTSVEVLAHKEYITPLNTLLWDAFLAYKSYARTPFEIELLGNYHGKNTLTSGAFVGGISAQNIAKVDVEITQMAGMGNWFLFEPHDISHFFNQSLEFQALAYVLQGINDFLISHQIQDIQITLKALYYDHHEWLWLFYKAVNRLLEPLVVAKTT